MTAHACGTVIWLGGGTRFGSQLNKIENPPPMTPSFFSDLLVQSMVPQYLATQLIR